jgi:hypothetical protein
MTIDAYLAQVSQINRALAADPQTLLALTAAWLDPLAILKDHDHLAADTLADFYYAGDRVGEGLYVTRNCFPDIYASAIGKLREGRTIQAVLDFIDDEIERQTTIPTSQYDTGHAYAYGIPMPWYGFDMDDPDFRRHYKEEWHLIQLFGGDINADESDSTMTTMDLPDNIWLIAYVLRWSLMEYRHSPLHETLMNAIAYTFSCSGNSSVDYSHTVGCEFQPLWWTSEEVEFASIICQEADDIMSSAQIGLANAYDPAIQRTLREKIDHAARCVQTRLDKGLSIYDDTFINDDTPNPFHIRWDDLRASPASDTESDPPELPVRLGLA